MLDQSFSTKNFETIFTLLNRQGKVEIDAMSEDYRAIHLTTATNIIRDQFMKIRVPRTKATKKSQNDYSSEEIGRKATTR